jgi:hypothetical protein
MIIAVIYDVLLSLLSAEDASTAGQKDPPDFDYVNRVRSRTFHLCCYDILKRVKERNQSSCTYRKERETFSATQHQVPFLDLGGLGTLES